MSEPTVATLDVRPILNGGQTPFEKIMSVVQSLTAKGDQLVIIAPFEPAPLYRVMEREGFDFENQAPRSDGGFEVRFTRR